MTVRAIFNGGVLVGVAMVFAGVLLVYGLGAALVVGGSFVWFSTIVATCLSIVSRRPE